MSSSTSLQVVALAGGVGGAKLAHGLAQVVQPAGLTIVVNTADDFEHLGLHISPDLDTVMYTLAGINNPATGWGLAGDTWQFLEALSRLGGETWFRLGDRDLATHVERTRRLRAGETLASVTADFCKRLGIQAQVTPMSNQPVRTVVHTAAGRLPFQEYFVRQRCEPSVAAFEFVGADSARPEPTFMRALEQADAVVICPSNPYVSVDPILRLPMVTPALRERQAPVVAVSPIVGGVALKGPAAKMMHELGVAPSAAGVAAHYGELLDGFVIDKVDEAAQQQIEAAGPRVLVADTVMDALADKAQLAQAVVDFAARLPRPHGRIK